MIKLILTIKNIIGIIERRIKFMIDMKGVSCSIIIGWNYLKKSIISFRIILTSIFLSYSEWDNVIYQRQCKRDFTTWRLKTSLFRSCHTIRPCLHPWWCYRSSWQTFATAQWYVALRQRFVLTLEPLRLFFIISTSLKSSHSFELAFCHRFICPRKLYFNTSPLSPENTTITCNCPWKMLDKWVARLETLSQWFLFVNWFGSWYIMQFREQFNWRCSIRYCPTNIM